MNAYCDRSSLEFNSIAFLFDGRQLHPDQTPDDVFDGHGGSEAAAYMKENALRFFFEDIDFPQSSEVDGVFRDEVENSIKKLLVFMDCIKKASGFFARAAAMFENTYEQNNIIAGPKTRSIHPTDFCAGQKKKATPTPVVVPVKFRWISSVAAFRRRGSIPALIIEPPRISGRRRRKSISSTDSMQTNISQHYKNPLEHDDEVDEDEEEDVDFNPFLRGSPSAEACSILSSEVDGSDGEVVESCAENVLHLSTGSSSNLFHNGQFQDSGDAEHDEASVLHTEVSFQQNGCEEAGSRNSDKRKPISSSGFEDGPVREKDNGPTSETEVAGNVLETEVESPSCRKPIIDFDNDDAICKRTRARYSLTGITLDELETFLQETDDDDDLQRIDDEEEYRKFLAAVLHGGPQDDRASPEEGNDEDEDEDDDADFEIEIEEALASDLDIDLEESWKDAEDQRPETRQNKHNNSSKHHREKLLEAVKRPLRPLFPVLPSLPIAPVPSVDGSYLMPEAVQSLFSPQELVNGFLPHQIGQLYCLLHDHVQLLVQVYSLSVLDPSRQHIASQIQGLLSEMVQKRDEILAQRSMPHPSFCFQFHYCHSLRTDGLQLETSGSSKKHRDSVQSTSDCSRQVSGIRSDEICAQSTPGSSDPFVPKPILEDSLSLYERLGADRSSIGAKMSSKGLFKDIRRRWLSILELRNPKDVWVVASGLLVWCELGISV
ncbi:hypothetical protein Droror1_Dr00024059 [Drosera rotundifolia]